MTVPTDLPGGEYLPELHRALMQAGVDKRGPSAYRGVVLMEGGQQASHLCDRLRATKMAALADAQEFIAGHAGTVQKQRRD